VRNDDNPMKDLACKRPAFCGALARTTGEPCRKPPLRGKTRCRLHGGKSTGRPPTTGRYTKQALRMRERMEFLMWLIKGIHGGDKKHCRFRATPERVWRLLGELIAERKTAAR
jgi:hypothetical protein